MSQCRFMAGLGSSVGSLFDFKKGFGEISAAITNDGIILLTIQASALIPKP